MKFHIEIKITYNINIRIFNISFRLSTYFYNIIKVLYFKLKKSNFFCIFYVYKILNFNFSFKFRMKIIYHKFNISILLSEINKIKNTSE